MINIKGAKINDKWQMINVKGAKPKLGYFARCILCLWKFLLPRLKLLWQIVRKISQKKFLRQLTVPPYKESILQYVCKRKLFYIPFKEKSMQLTNKGLTSHYKEGFHTIGVSQFNDVKTVWWKTLWCAKWCKKRIPRSCPYSLKYFAISIKCVLWFPCF